MSNKAMAWWHAGMVLMWLFVFFFKFASILTVFFVVLSAAVASEHTQWYLKEIDDE